MKGLQSALRAVGKLPNGSVVYEIRWGALDRSRYQPHQGTKERARRRSQGHWGWA